jgi:hypothetical protein
VATSVHVDPDDATRAAEKAERRRRRAERRDETVTRKVEKAALKGQRRTHNARRHDDSPTRSRTHVRRHRDSRSSSPGGRATIIALTATVFVTVLDHSIDVTPKDTHSYQEAPGGEPWGRK